MSQISDYFYSIGEPYAAGIFENPQDSYTQRYCRAERRFWENCALPVYDRGDIYPCGEKSTGPYAVNPNYSFTYNVTYNALPQQAREYMQTLPFPWVKAPHHTIGGCGYTHSMPNYLRVAKEGLNHYQARINNIKDDSFRSAMNDVLEGVRVFHSRCLAYLKEINAKPTLISALERVPFEPAQNLYEAIVCRNFVYYLDGCDNIGRLDAELYEWYNGEDVTDILRQMFISIDINCGWTGALGPDYNPLTYQCLKAVKGLRRPTLELRVTKDIPDALWDLAEETIKSGGGQPSFYNEELYQKGLLEKFPTLTPEDALKFCGGGCTETMLAGISNVGSLDAGVNYAYIFAVYMQENLTKCSSFEEFYDGYIKEAINVTLDVLDAVSTAQMERAQTRSLPMRTLLVDDCIANESDFHQKGARYYWSVINCAGLINVIDSLLAIRELVYNKKLYTRDEFVAKLNNGELCRAEDAYGVGNEANDSLAADLTDKIFSAYNLKTPYLGGAFLPSSIQFATYVEAGKKVPATPDGRCNGDELCDSLAAIHGNDKEGCLAMLRSVATLPLYKALGTPVVNLKLNKSHVSGHLRDIVKGFFSMGGMQLQVTCQSRKDMEDAMDNPDKYPNLIVRLGGYSEYFNRIDRKMQQTIIDRTEY